MTDSPQDVGLRDRLSARLGSRYFFTPWKVALFGAVISLVFAFLYATVAAFETVNLLVLPAISSVFPIGAMVAASVGWSLFALVRRSRYGHTFEATLGLLLSLIAGAVTTLGFVGYLNA
jgi:hypothetical protein